MPPTAFNLEPAAAEPSRYRGPHIYRAIPCLDAWGSGDGTDFITGVTLERVSPEPEWDPIFDDIAEAGTDAAIHLPEGGLVVGQLYTVHVETYTDWETGIVDDYDTYIMPYEGTEETA